MQIKDHVQVSLRVPFLTEEKIEHDAEALLGDFERKRGNRIAPPVPIEDIVEKHLKLGIELDDLHRVLGVPRSSAQTSDIIGAIFFDERRVVIDESLDPEERRNMEGRYRFTLAHEGGGHWRLHRHLFAKDPAQASFLEAPSTPSIVCRSSGSKEPAEWQADFYAACLLMPRRLILEAWLALFSDGRPRVMDRARREAVSSIADAEERAFQAKVEEWENEQNMERLARPLAEQFLVSPIAMRIRLEKLGLLYREAPHQRILAGCV
jgi:Zn-dependent peptidase ImmA (M78 family)